MPSKKCLTAVVAVAGLVFTAASAMTLDVQGANRPELKAAVQAVAGNLATTKVTGPGIGANYAPVLLFEERHDLRAVQIQEAIAMSRLHDQFGMKDIALEGYLQDDGPINTSWVRKASASGNSIERARVFASLLKEGEISSAEFMKLVYDDVQLHPVEVRKDYDVTASDKAEGAPFGYLMAMAQHSFPPSRYGELKTIEKRMQLLPQNSAAARTESRKFINTLLSADPWTKEKYEVLSDPKKSQALSGEDQLALAEEIERRAVNSSVDIGTEDRAGMREYINFWRGRMKASETMVGAITGISKNEQVQLISGVIGSFHTSGMAHGLQAVGIPYAILRPLAMDDEKRAGPLGTRAFEQKYQRLSVYTEGFSKQLISIFATKKKPQHVLETEWFQAKSETYLMTDLLTRRLLGAAAPPPADPTAAAGSARAGGGELPPVPPSGPPWGFSDDDLNGKRIRIDPRLISVVAAAPGSKRRAILFPIIVNPDDPARRKQLWVKAALTQGIEDRKSVEDILSDALRDVTSERGEPRTKAEDNFGRIQITKDVHAAIAETRAGAMKVALGV